MIHKDFYLRNHSVVPVSFSLVREEKDDISSAFVISPCSGVVELQSEIRIEVKYYPLNAGVYSCEHFRFITPGE